MDTDAEGVVYYANYLGFFERGRIELLEKMGVDLGAIKDKDNIIFAISKIDCNYKAPAKLYETIRVTTEITEITAARIVFKQEVFREKQLLVSASVTACAIDMKNFRLARLPKSLLP
ncbi:MAG: YbgC/FadM family acyl-CoA thioesterase [Candidatus Saganbacteria bacterium]|nr:YbgC/FadM family acyl-CoA thioesterase [Candidatus Saganbacteria bacterium]